jgi:hypothetical protein
MSGMQEHLPEPHYQPCTSPHGCQGSQVPYQQLNAKKHSDYKTADGARSPTRPQTNNPEDHQKSPQKDQRPDHHKDSLQFHDHVLRVATAHMWKVMRWAAMTMTMTPPDEGVTTPGTAKWWSLTKRRAGKLGKRLISATHKNDIKEVRHLIAKGAALGFADKAYVSSALKCGINLLD